MEKKKKTMKCERDQKSHIKKKSFSVDIYIQSCQTLPFAIYSYVYIFFFLIKKGKDEGERNKEKRKKALVVYII